MCQTVHKPGGRCVGWGINGLGGASFPWPARPRRLPGENTSRRSVCRAKTIAIAANATALAISRLPGVRARRRLRLPCSRRKAHASNRAVHREAGVDRGEASRKLSRPSSPRKSASPPWAKCRYGSPVRPPGLRGGGEGGDGEKGGGAADWADAAGRAMQAAARAARAARAAVVKRVGARAAE